jgi:hypothetical protein
MMNKRDLLADLKFCDRATQGPWRHEWNPDCSEVYAPGVDKPIILVGHDPYDADFIVQAREGWPHAIERALKAEALARELVDMLERATPRYLEGRPELDLSAFLSAKWLLKKAKEVLGDEETCAGRQSASAKDY